MIIYERITFLLVTGTLGLFLVALALGAWGITLTLNPGLDARVAKRLSAFLAKARATAQRARGAYQAARSRWIPAS